MVNSLHLIQTKALKKIYGKGENGVNALDGIDLTIDQGEFTAIIGASGSGKSTLLHLLGGLDRPTSGAVLVNGEDIYRLPASRLAVFRRRNFGFVFQFFNLVPILTVEENIALPVLMDGKKPDKAHIDNLIGALGLEDKRGVLPAKLSGGQQQRVAIGRALAAKPRIIYADEPTGSLDSKTGTEIMDVFKLMAEKFSQTVVIVTHDSRVASQCRRTIEISDGAVKCDTGDVCHEN